MSLGCGTYLSTMLLDPGNLSRVCICVNMALLEDSLLEISILPQYRLHAVRFRDEDNSSDGELPTMNHRSFHHFH